MNSGGGGAGSRCTHRRAQQRSGNSRTHLLAKYCPPTVCEASVPRKNCDGGRFKGTVTGVLSTASRVPSAVSLNGPSAQASLTLRSFSSHLFLAQAPQWKVPQSKSPSQRSSYPTCYVFFVRWRRAQFSLSAQSHLWLQFSLSVQSHLCVRSACLPCCQSSLCVSITFFFRVRPVRDRALVARLFLKVLFFTFFYANCCKSTFFAVRGL